MILENVSGGLPKPKDMYKPLGEKPKKITNGELELHDRKTFETIRQILLKSILRHKKGGDNNVSHDNLVQSV